MHEFTSLAQAKLAESKRFHAERLAALDPIIDVEKYEEAKKARPDLALIEVPLAEWRAFLKSHKPPDGNAEAAGIFRALCAGASGAGGAPVVYVQARDVLALTTDVPDLDP